MKPRKLCKDTKIQQEIFRARWDGLTFHLWVSLRISSASGHKCHSSGLSKHCCFHLTFCHLLHTPPNSASLAPSISLHHLSISFLSSLDLHRHTFHCKCCASRAMPGKWCLSHWESKQTEWGWCWRGCSVTVLKPRHQTTHCSNHTAPEDGIHC